MNWSSCSKYCTSFLGGGGRLSGGLGGMFGAGGGMKGGFGLLAGTGLTIGTGCGASLWVLGIWSWIRGFPKIFTRGSHLTVGRSFLGV